MGAFLSSYFIAKFSKRMNYFGVVSVIQGRALILAGSSLPTSHPAGLCPRHFAFGTGEPRKAAPLFKTALMYQAGQRRRPLGSVYPAAVQLRLNFEG